MTIITPTGITGINSITSSGSTLVFQSASGTSPVVTGLDNISSSGIITATGFVGNVTGNVNSSGVSTFAAGSASAPSISATGDSNTGIFFPAADTIAFAEGGVETARFDNNGRLGIGTAFSPNARLDVSLDGFVANTLSQVRSNSWGANGIINLYNAKGGATGSEVLLLGSQAGGLGQLASGIGFGRENDGNWGTYLSFKTHSTSTSTIDELYERVRINSSGNLGIGTANPTSKLHVVDGNITAGDVTLGQTHIDIMKMWRTADIQGYKSDYSDGGAVSYTWDNGTVRVDTSTGSHNWDVGKVRLPAGVYQIHLQYRPSPTQHGWNVYGTNSNAHRIRLQSDAGYGSYTEFLVINAQLNKDVGYSRLFTSETYQVTTETTYRIGMQTDPYVTGGYKCFVESAYLIKLR